jgi:hypothetical protein
LGKVGTDVVLTGHAYAQRYGDPYVDVSLSVGRLKKTVRVFGDRWWERSLGIYRASKAIPFRRIPLVYERAFGGVDRSHSDQKRHEWEMRNPVGVGFRAKRSKLPLKGARLPNIEDPNDLISRPRDRPEPAGFGFIAPSWKPRTEYQGTYDANWQRKRMPLLPEDFDDRFNNAASHDLIADGYFVGGELVQVRNATPSGVLRFRIPCIMLESSLLIDAEICRIDMQLDTVVIDTDLSRFILTWRGTQNVHKSIENIRWIRAEVGETANAL